MVQWKTRFLAFLEVFSVSFLGIPLVTLGIYRLFPGFENWQTETLMFPYPVFVDVVMMAAAVGMVLLRGKRLADYGFKFRPLKYHLDTAAACFIPVVVATLPFGLGVDYTAWSGALILAAVQIGLLFVLARILRGKPAPASLGMLGGLALLPGLNTAGGYLVGKALVVFLTYALFVGFGEEMLYRGYIQSRLNEAFGKPLRFYGVTFGWGAVMASLLFGLTHVGVLRWILGLGGGVTWAWGFWTFFSGLVFSLVREKSGSILAPALLHGIPQAVAMAVMVFL